MIKDIFMDAEQQLIDLRVQNALLTEIIKIQNLKDNPFHVKIGELTNENRKLKNLNQHILIKVDMLETQLENVSTILRNAPIVIWAESAFEFRERYKEWFKSVNNILLDLKII
jgi:hypothetical protein